MGIADARETIRACRYCFMCRYSCPTFLATKRESVTPRGYALQLMMIDQGKQGWTEDMVSAFYQCSLCGLGREHCEFDWLEDELVRQARAEIVSTEHAPKAVQAVANALLNNGTPWNGKVSLPLDKPNVEVLYLAGCQTREHHPEIVAATAEVFAALDIEWSALGKENCCGGGLFDLGYLPEARQKAQNLADQITGLKPKTVVTGCAHCFRSLKEFYPKWGVNLPKNVQVMHTAEFLNRMTVEGRLKLDSKPEETSLGYHDPCMLGRKMSVYEPPRNLIEAATGQSPVELFHEKELAECCGAGAVTYLVEPEVSRKIARLRLERAAEAGTPTLVTACQNCKMVLQDAARGSDVHVLDLVELVARHLA